MDDISDVQQFYNSPDCPEDVRLEQHQLEQDITRRVLAHFLPPRCHILEIGAATGRYTVWLAEQGHRITAVDLSASLLERCQERVGAAGYKSSVRFFVADARDLSPVPQQKYDAILLMGPLYHLILQEDRARSVREGIDRLKPHGILFSAFLSRYGLIGSQLARNPDWIKNQQEVRSVIEKGYNDDNPRDGRFRGYFATVPEIQPLHEQAGLETLALVGVEPAIAANDDIYNRLQGQQRKRWLDVLFEMSQEPSQVASSRHLLYVGRKSMA